MTFGDDWGWGAAKDEARKVYDAFREAGGNFIDTANFYTNGTSESFSRRVYEGSSPERGPGHEIHHVCSGHRSERGWQSAQEYGAAVQLAADTFWRLDV